MSNNNHQKSKELKLRRNKRDPWQAMPRRIKLTLGTLMFVAVPTLSLILFPLRPTPEIEVPDVGTISAREWIAPHDVPIQKDPEVLAREQHEAARAVPPVLTWDASAVETVDGKLARVRRTLVSPPADQLPAAEFQESVARQLGLELSTDTIEFLQIPENVVVLDSTRTFLARVLAQPIVPDEVQTVLADHEVVDVRSRQNELYRAVSAVMTVSAARELAEREADRRFAADAQAQRAFAELATALLVANAGYDRVETEARRQIARSEIPVTDGEIRRGQRIIDSHEIFTDEHVRIIRSLRDYESANLLTSSVGGGWLPNIGRFAAICLLLLVFLIYSRSQNPEIYHDLRSWGVLTTLGVLAVTMIFVTIGYFDRSAVLVPVAALPLLAALLLNRGVALFLALMIPFLFLILLVPNGVVLSPAFLIGASVAGVAAVLAAENIQRRHELYLPVILVGGSYVLAAVAVGMAVKTPAAQIVQDSVQGILSALIAGALTMVLLPVFEKVFRITTNFTLLELLDRNHPLLQRMAIEAPGTFHHSMLVAELAREAVAAIGGNPLLAQVGAYYHDIGKMEKPEYFIENQTGKNVHDKLTPTMSCLVLGSHVREGVIMAEEAGLPREIIAFIPEHHGTTLMSYFFHKARKGDEGVDEADFRYPGPRPHRKETAVVMLADSVEATARSLPEPNPGMLRTVVKRLVDARIADGQMDTSALTLSDIARVKESFVSVLSRFFHTRIQYPGQELRRDTKETKRTEAGKQSTELKVAPQGEEVPKRTHIARTGAMQADGSVAVSVQPAGKGNDAHSSGGSAGPDPGDASRPSPSDSRRMHRA